MSDSSKPGSPPLSQQKAAGTVEEEKAVRP